jgi:carbamoyl-phosphate synthase small subunit
MQATLALEDGKVFHGQSFGAPGAAYGEVVFNTALSGYQEVLTDPSYKGQMVTMTYPLIGNYGVNPEDAESCRPWVEAFIVKEASRVASNWRSRQSLGDYLTEHKIVGIEGIDTRALTKHLRTAGSLKAVVSTTELDAAALVQKARASQGLTGLDLVKPVTCQEPYEWDAKRTGEKLFNVVVVDCGVKYNILRRLAERKCRAQVVPASFSAKDILALDPDGVLLSNGPGDPEGIPYVVETVKQLMGRVPMFGICMGHHMLTMALGGKTRKLKFGHHGGNHPVKDLATGRAFISVQNHNFYCDLATLDTAAVEITHLNLNDNTLEGIRHKYLPMFAVQFHPEAAPGPHDTAYLFDNFTDMMKACKRK